MLNACEKRGIIAAFIVVLALSACGGGHRQAPAPAASSPASASVLPLALQAELDAATPPAGVDAALFSRLKEALREALRERQQGASRVMVADGKVVATPPHGPKNVIDDLALHQDSGSGDLTWSYHNSGDYNQDGLVSVLDLTPLAAHFQENVEGGAPINEIVDGNGDGVINIADITPLAASFGVELADYVVEGADDTEETSFSEVGTADLSSASGEGRKQLTYHLDSLDNLYYRVVPRDSHGERGDPSNVVPVIQEGDPPTINGVSPLIGSPGEEVTFTADVSGTPPFTYAWDFDGGATPQTSTDESPQVTLTTPNTYHCSVTVSNALGEHTLDFDLVVAGLPHIESVTPEAGPVGTEVTFHAVVTGDTPITYEWDFDGGADPNIPVTDEPQVRVTLQMFGTYDATLTATNSYGSDTYPFELVVGWPPTLSSVQPETGVTGRAVEFSATVFGTPPFDYIWDFGDGATPSSSTLPNPSVIMRAIGNYDGSVTVSNPFGEDTLPFTYEVIPVPPVPHIKGVNPTSGFPHTEVTFTADVEGEPPFTYAWNFGFGAEPNTSDEPSPTVTLGDEDEYHAHLVVTNAHGEDTYQFNLWVSFAGAYDETEDNDKWQEANVLPEPPLTGFTGSIGPDGYNGDTTDYFAFTGIAGYRVTSRIDFNSADANLNLELFDTDGTTRLARSSGSGDSEYIEKVLPTSGTFYLHVYRGSGGTADYTLDYDVHEVNLWPSTVVAGSSLGESAAGQYTALAVVGGKPAIAYHSVSGEEGDLKFAINSEADAGGSWAKSNIDTANNNGQEPSLAEVDGKPAVSYFWNVPVQGGDMGVRFAVNSEADGSGTWSPRSKVDGSAGPANSIAEVNGTLAVAYSLPETGARFAINAQPDGSGAWTRYTVEAGDFKAISLAVVGDKPAVAYISEDGATVRFAINTANDGSGAWNANTVESVPAAAFNAVSLAEIDGRPAIAYTKGHGFLLRFAINELADGSGSWDLVSVGAPHFSGAVCLRSIGGLPSIAALNTLSFDLRFLQNSAADATGEWMEELVDNVDSVGWGCSLAEVAGKPAISYGDGTNGDLKFARKP